MAFGQRLYRHVLAAALILLILCVSLLLKQPPVARFEEAYAHYVPSSFDWKAVKQAHPVSILTTLPGGAPKILPHIQHDFNTPSLGAKLTAWYRRSVVQKAFRKSWKSYKQYAWMHDELRPLTAGSQDPYGGWAATLIDSLDTLWIMGLKDDFYTATQAVGRIDWANSTESACNVFETTIRHLGGLLSAYDLSQEPVLLIKATELGDMLYLAFDTPNRMPPFWLDFDKAKKGELISDQRQATASFGSLSLEFTRLAQLTHNKKYYDAVDKVTQLLAQTQFDTQIPGMWPTYANLRDSHFREDNTFTMGAGADSMYEYLPKMYLLLAGRAELYKDMFQLAADTIEKHLLFRPMLPHNENVLFSGVATTLGDSINLRADSEHLTCFTGGMFGLGGRILENPHHVELGEALTRGCAYAYDAFPTGIMPELFAMVDCRSTSGCAWDEDRWNTELFPGVPSGFTHARDASYSLRPEAIESVFILYRITGRKEYVDIAWRMFRAIQKATTTRLGNSAIASVNVKGQTQKKDSMESFWLAETLKYFYLIFSAPEVISLDEYVFNTEAHPFKLDDAGKSSQ